jgi:hypothetical protein
MLRYELPATARPRLALEMGTQARALIASARIATFSHPVLDSVPGIPFP